MPGCRPCPHVSQMSLQQLMKLYVVYLLVPCACVQATSNLINGCIFSPPFRACRSMRNKYGGLMEEPCGDCVVHWCCSPCAICQGKSADVTLLPAHHCVLTFQLVRPAEAREIKV